MLKDYLAERGITASVVRLDGAVESSVRLGVADAIADVVETGNTPRAAGMEIFGDPILQSEAVLIGRAGKAPWASTCSCAACRASSWPGST